MGSERVNIYYLVRNDVKKRSDIGFLKKFRGQIKTFSKFGDVLFAYFESGDFCAEHICEKSEHSSRIKKIKNIFFLTQILYYAHVARLFKKFRPDVVYIRYKISEPVFLFFLKYIKKSFPACKVFLEFAWFPYDSNWERESLVKRIFLPMDRLFRTRLHRYVDYAVNVNQNSSIYGIKTLCIMNGIDTDSVPLRGPVVEDSSTLVLIGVACVGYWHGFDRVIMGLKEYYECERDPRRVLFKVVGEGKELPRLKKLVRKAGLFRNVEFSGQLVGEKLENVFRTAHVGIGMLGMHRLSDDAYTSLKSREYACRGIPFISSGGEKGFPEDLKYLKHVPADDSPLKVKDVIEFYESISREEDHGFLFRKFAEDHFSWDKQLKDVTSRF
jgi:glycosyltransferase involved in cell wall biosynthesis